MKTYKYKLYTKAKDGYLDSVIDRFGIVYNFCIALHRRLHERYYRLFHKKLNSYAIKKHITKLKQRPKFESIFKGLPSQAIQEVCERIDNAYDLFFRNLKNKAPTAPPSFKKVKKYKSFTLKQAGYKFQDNRIQLTIDGKKWWYGFFKSREIEGKIKTVTIKRDACGDMFIIVVTDKEDVEELPKSGKSVGYDFGMKTFLVASDNEDIEAPLFLRKCKEENCKLSQAISSKKKGSNNRKKAVLQKARFLRKIANQRADFQWKLANDLVKKYDVMCFEDLNLKEISSKFGEKIGEYGFGEFLSKLQYIAQKHGKNIVSVDRYFPSSKKCHKCGYIKKDLTLSDRDWKCPGCGETRDRDRNAAINIYREGMRIKTLKKHQGGASSCGRDVVRPDSSELADVVFNPESQTL